MNFSWLHLRTMLHQPTFLLRKARIHQTGIRTKSWRQLLSLLFLLLSTTAWILSPEYSPLSSVHDEDGDGVADADDMFKFNPTQSQDADGDGYGDNQIECNKNRHFPK